MRSPSRIQHLDCLNLNMKKMQSLKLRELRTQRPISRTRRTESPATRLWDLKLSQDSFIWTSNIDLKKISSEKDCSFLLDYTVIFPKYNVKNTRFLGLETDFMNFDRIACIVLQWIGETALKPICNKPTTKLLSHFINNIISSLQITQSTT